MIQRTQHHDEKVYLSVCCWPPGTSLKETGIFSIDLISRRSNHLGFSIESVMCHVSYDANHKTNSLCINCVHWLPSLIVADHKGSSQSESMRNNLKGGRSPKRATEKSFSANTSVTNSSFCTHTNTVRYNAFSFHIAQNNTKNKWQHNKYRRLKNPFWLACEVVELLFQPTVGRHVNPDAFLPGFVHLFFNSLHTQEQEGQDPMVRDGEREEE